MKFNIPKIAYFLIFSYLGSYQATLATINLFIRPYPEQKDPSLEKLQQHLETPGKLAAKTVKKLFLSQAPHTGIFATYWGYLALSDFNGLLSFPRKHAKATFNLLVTPNINPIFMIGNTIHHWEIDRSVSSELYTITLRQDPSTKRWLWETKKSSLPKNNIISLNTIVLFAKPNALFVPLGVTLTTNNPQLVLPDIYAKKTMNIAKRALDVLMLKQFFGSLNKIMKQDSPTSFSEKLNVQ
jgi:hypothetical protein